jgi:hypothetical protein
MLKGFFGLLLLVVGPFRTISFLKHLVLLS